MSTSSEPAPSSIAAPWATTALALIDAVIQDRVLIYGSLPPEGGDLDILARPAELRAIREALVTAGFVPVGRMLVRFRTVGREMVELTPAASWGLPPDEVEALFAEAQPIDGTLRVARPSPHHTLLIRARKAVRRRASLQKLGSRTDLLPDDAPDAWQRAGERASAWRAEYALRMIRAASEHQGRVPLLIRWHALIEQLDGREERSLRGRVRVVRGFLPRALVPRIRRTHVIAFSGLDGSGKTSQARLLRDALRASGYDAVVVWAGIGTNRSLGWIKTPVKRCLRALPRIGPFAEVVDRVTPKSGGKPRPLADPGARVRNHGFWFNFVTQIWMTIMALVHVYSLRRVVLRSFGKGRIIIFDRYTLDSAVRLRHWYGDSMALKLVVKLIHFLVMRPVRSYFLEVPPHVAFERKPEWELNDLVCRAALYREGYARLGVRRLDGMRPMEELFAEIARDAWSALR